jgi:DNA-binding transcriptional ArsR family regulator
MRRYIQSIVDGLFNSGEEHGVMEDDLGEYETVEEFMEDTFNRQAARDIMYILADFDEKGVEPAGTDLIDEVSEIQTIHENNVYTSLSYLAGKGLVDKKERDGRTNAYSLTDAGYNVLRAKREWDDEHVGELLD